MLRSHHAAIEPALISVTLILTTLGFPRVWLRDRRSNRERVGGWHASVFILGLVCIGVATASPLAVLDHSTLTVHMVQHLLLMTFAPPLILLGAPLQAQEPRRSGPAHKSNRTLISPTFCWLAAASTLVAWHIPSMFMLAMRSEAWHAIEQASFLLSGFLFWWPVVQPRLSGPQYSEWPILLYLFLATLPCDILSGFLVFCDRVVYPAYFSVPKPSGMSALADQQCAGALMWTCVTVVYFIAGAIITARLLSPGLSRQEWAVRSNSPLDASTQKTRSSLETI